MDGVMVKKHMIKKAQIAIKQLGVTDASRWSALSPFDELTAKQFAGLLAKFNVSVNPEEVKALWKMTGITTPTLDFKGFVQFLYCNMPPSPFDPDSLTSFFDSLSHYRNSLLPWFTANDLECTGSLPNNKFEQVIRQVRPQTTDIEIAKLTQKYSSDKPGHVNYFLLLSDLSSAAERNTTELDPTPRPVTGLQTPTKAPQLMQVKMNDLNLPAIQHSTGCCRGPGNGCRGKLDPEIFPGCQPPTRGFIPEEDLPKSPNCSCQVRRNSFSEVKAAATPVQVKISPRTPQRPPPQPRTVKLEGTNRSDEAARELAKRFEESGSAQAFFHKWQNNGKLGVDEIHNGVFSDFEIDFPTDDLKAIADAHGGPFTLSDFVALISRSIRKPERTVNLTQLRKETEDDVVLTRIAERTYGKKWEEATSAAVTADDFISGLRTIGVFMCSDDIRDMFDSNGKDAFIDTIKERQRAIFARNVSE